MLKKIFIMYKGCFKTMCQKYKGRYLSGNKVSAFRIKIWGRNRSVEAKESC